MEDATLSLGHSLVRPSLIPRSYHPHNTQHAERICCYSRNLARSRSARKPEGLSKIDLDVE